MKMEYIALKDVCKINMGQSPSSSSYNENEDGIPFFQGNADFGERYPVARVWCNNPTKVANPGDILLSVRAPIGALNYAKENCCIGRGLAALTPNRDKVLIEYIYWVLKSKNIELNSKGTGSTFKAISRKVLEETMIPDIDLEGQQRCVEILEKLYRVIQMRKKKYRCLDELVRGRFVELFGTVENNVFNFDVKTIGEVATLKSGTSLPSEIENEGGNVPYIKVGDMNYSGNEYYITTSSRYVTEKTAGKGIFEIGTVIFPKRGGAIGTNKKRLTTLPICADLNVMGVTPNKSHILPSYLMAYFDLVDLGSLDNGSSVPQINNKDIAPLRICIPPIEIQNQFADFVKQIDKSKLIVQKELDETQLLFDSLMQEYFG